MNTKRWTDQHLSLTLRRPPQGEGYANCMTAYNQRLKKR